jgi:hypothetical protein
MIFVLKTKLSKPGRQAHRPRLTARSDTAVLRRVFTPGKPGVIGPSASACTAAARA